jgi:ketopantoate reductase
MKTGSVEKSQLPEVERLQLKENSFELVVENRVEFWRWQKKVIEKKLKRN